MGCETQEQVTHAAASVKICSYQGPVSPALVFALRISRRFCPISAIVRFWWMDTLPWTARTLSAGRGFRFTLLLLVCQDTTGAIGHFSSSSICFSPHLSVTSKYSNTSRTVVGPWFHSSYMPIHTNNCIWFDLWIWTVRLVFCSLDRALRRRAGSPEILQQQSKSWICPSSGKWPAALWLEGPLHWSHPWDSGTCFLATAAGGTVHSMTSCHLLLWPWPVPSSHAGHRPVWLMHDCPTCCRPVFIGGYSINHQPSFVGFISCSVTLLLVFHLFPRPCFLLSLHLSRN